MEGKLVNKFFLKISLVIAQSCLFTVLIIYPIFQNQIVAVPIFLSIAFLLTQKCSQCGTSFTDSRINEKFQVFKFYKTDLIDNCPVCGNKMYLE